MSYVSRASAEACDGDGGLGRLFNYYYFSRGKLSRRCAAAGLRAARNVTFVEANDMDVLISPGESCARVPQSLLVLRAPRV